MMTNRYAVVLILAALISFPTLAQVQQGGMRGDRAYGTSLAPTPLDAGKPTVAKVTRSQQAMSKGETLENFDGDYPYWTGDQTFDVTRSTTQIARDQAEWENLWLRIGQPPPIDLPKSRSAVAIMIGPREGEGYHVRITDIRKVGQGLHIIYLESKPISADNMQQRQRKKTSPWLIKLIPDVEGTIRFFSSGK